MHIGMPRVLRLATAIILQACLARSSACLTNSMAWCAPPLFHGPRPVAEAGAILTKRLRGSRMTSEAVMKEDSEKLRILSPNDNGAHIYL
jgi:hypothetical protein